MSLQGFADASKSAVCATIYAVVTYLDGRTEPNLLAAKSRIAPRGLSIPRLELVAARMPAKLMKHVKTVIGLIDTEVDMWPDSMTTLYWLASNGPWSHFVTKRGGIMFQQAKIAVIWEPEEYHLQNSAHRGLRDPIGLQNRVVGPKNQRLLR